MVYLRAFFIILAVSLPAVSAVTPEELRGYFEWGEYRQLIEKLEPLLADSSDHLDSARCARYHLYLGVALYGTGRVGDARKHFLAALRHDPTLQPDRRYISEEIENLFSVTLSDYTEEQRRIMMNDSLLAQQQQAFKANVRELQYEELRRSRFSGRMIAVSTTVIGVAVTGIALYEYYTTRQPYNEFQHAATSGDIVEYNRIQPIIRRANGIITGCAVTAGISEVAGLFFAIRTRMQRRAVDEGSE